MSRSKKSQNLFKYSLINSSSPELKQTGAKTATCELNAINRKYIR